MLLPCHIPFHWNHSLLRTQMFAIFYGTCPHHVINTFHIGQCCCCSCGRTFLFTGQFGSPRIWNIFTREEPVVPTTWHSFWQDFLMVDWEKLRFCISDFMSAFAGPDEEAVVDAGWHSSWLGSLREDSWAVQRQVEPSSADDCMSDVTQHLASRTPFINTFLLSPFETVL